MGVSAAHGAVGFRAPWRQREAIAGGGGQGRGAGARATVLLVLLAQCGGHGQQHLFRGRPYQAVRGGDGVTVHAVGAVPGLVLLYGSRVVFGGESKQGEDAVVVFGRLGFSSAVRCGRGT